MTEPVNNISQLDTRPNAVNGLTADQLKAEFDKGPQAIKKFLNEVLIPALDGAVTLEALGAVPNTRTVARKALSADILLDESDIDYDGTIDGTRVQGDLGDAIDTIGQKLGNAVPNTRTVNGKPLAQDIRLGASDIDYSGKIGEYEASNVGGAIEALAAKKELAVFSASISGTMSDKFSSAATFPEISAAYEAGKQIWLDVYSRLTSLHRLIPLTFFNTTSGLAIFSASGIGNRTILAKLTYDSRATPQNTWEYSNNLADADDVLYDGKIGNTSVDRVKTALDLLSVGNPLDMTDDYTASGAASLEQWATMAKVVDGVASTTEYRIAPGRYRIVDDGDNPYDVTVINSSDPTRRYVQIITVSDDGIWTFNVYWTLEPSDALIHIVRFAPDEAMLEFGNGKNMLLPQYSDKVAGGDYDKFLQLTLVGQKVIPKWKRYEAKDIPFQNSMTTAGRASNVEEALDELYAAGILDATELYETSGAGYVAAWAGMADAQDETRYRVPSGTYRVRDSDSDGNYVEHIVTITDSVYEWSGRTYRYRQVEDKFCGSEPCINVAWYQFDAPGEETKSLSYYGDDECFSVDGVNKHWLPTVTAADNGKCLRVVDGGWQPAPFTEIKSVAALPQNPDPNVLYLIREAEST